ncbi:dihydroorotate dehydrogenase [Candidatus Woesearchaeota archaeon]|nr:dihydroorotate dehydrogenase [Candidatus Woesearchaeota archaeon]
MGAIVDISTILCGIRLENPTILASGILGTTGASLVNVLNHGAGAVTSKSIGLEERKGHPNPVFIEWEKGFINAVGLSGQGIEESVEEIKYAVENSESPVIASIFASNVKEFGVVAKEISKAKPNFIEVNISCPNVEAEFGKPFGTDPDVSAKVTKIVKKNTSIPVIVKLSPNVSNIKLIAKAVEKAGADAISAINTLGPGMVINLETAKPILANKAGGVSGPAIKPIAVRCVYDIYSTVKIPIIGTGGVTYGRDAIEMFMAGASAVGIGTGVYYRGVDVFRKVSEEIEEFMEKNGYNKLKEIIGMAHK